MVTMVDVIGWLVDVMVDKLQETSLAGCGRGRVVF